VSAAHAARADVIDAVIDTNIWLDLLVFRDPGVAQLAAALEQGRLRAHVDAFGLSELTRVLAYPLGRFHLAEAEQAAVLADCRSMALEFHRDATAMPALAVPLCRDPHDQPFLELARDCKAAWLITKDRDLLMLAAQMALRQGVAILTPRAATALLAPVAKRAGRAG
jgi:putative PIN family toxin of toxin-antitoxin system